MSNWLKPTVEITKHRYIVAIVDIDIFIEDEPELEMLMLYFDGIKNRWHEKRGRIRDIEYKLIKKWMPIPNE